MIQPKSAEAHTIENPLKLGRCADPIPHYIETDYPDLILVSRAIAVELQAENNRLEMHYHAAQLEIKNLENDKKLAGEQINNLESEINIFRDKLEEQKRLTASLAEGLIIGILAAEDSGDFEKEQSMRNILAKYNESLKK